VKRPKKMLRFDPLRVALVRNLARPFDRPSVSAERPKTGAMPSDQFEEAVAPEAASAAQFSF